jgi:hypothetical protein
MFFRKTIEARNKLNSSEEMSDREFIEAVQIPPDSEGLALTIREFFADRCGVSREKIRPDTDFEAINRTMRSGLLEGWDRLDFVFSLEKKYRVKIHLPIEAFNSLKLEKNEVLKFETFLQHLLKCLVFVK